MKWQKSSLLSPMFYFFQLKFQRKLNNDWKLGTHRERIINAPGLVNSAKMFANSSKIVCGVDETVMVAEIVSGESLMTLQGSNALITCVDLLSIDSK